MANDPACLFIDASTEEGLATGIAINSVVSCLFMMTVYEDAVERVLGSLSPALCQKIDGCLKVALALS